MDSLNPDVKLILEEVTRYLNMEKLLPSYRNIITVRYNKTEAFHLCSDVTLLI